VKRMMQQVLFGDVGTSGSGEEVWKQWRMVNTVKMLYTCGCKWKNDICWNYFRNERRGN
jgi:hypothetical protein